MRFSAFSAIKWDVSQESVAVLKIIPLCTWEGESVMREDLLEYIFTQINEECLSDLRIPSVFYRHLGFIMNIDEQMFAIKDWNQLLNYLYLPNKEANSVKEAKEMLKQWAQQKK